MNERRHAAREARLSSARVAPAGPAIWGEVADHITPCSKGISDGFLDEERLSQADHPTPPARPMAPDKMVPVTKPACEERHRGATDGLPCLGGTRRVKGVAWSAIKDRYIR